MKDLITVVVPIYNVEEYLEKCIDSILTQTYQYIELILVDDGSTDSCGIICDNYEKKDNRIKVIHKKNGGLSDARNVGISIANGKYITFVDSDDFITNSAIETLYKNIIKYKKDISIGQMMSFYDKNNIKCEKKEEKIKAYKRNESMEELLYNTTYTSSTAGKLFSTKLFDKIKFPYGKKYEDLATVYKLVFQSNGVVVTNQIVYNYFRNRVDSIMNENFSDTRMDALYFTEDILNFVKKEIPNIEIAAITRLIIESRDILIEIPNDKRYKEYEKNIYEYIKKYRLKVLLNKKLPTKQRISLFPILFGKRVIRIAWNVKMKIKNIKNKSKGKKKV